jgi:hypothetical protein
MSYAWNNIILPGSGTITGKQEREKHYAYDLKHLTSEANYEAQLQAKNKYGWSERSDLLKFFTHSQLVTGKKAFRISMNGLD